MLKVEKLKFQSTSVFQLQRGDYVDLEILNFKWGTARAGN